MDHLVAEVAVTVASRDVDERLEVLHPLGQVHEFLGPAHVHRDGLAELIVKLDGGGGVKDDVDFLFQLAPVAI